MPEQKDRRQFDDEARKRLEYLIYYARYGPGTLTVDEVKELGILADLLLREHRRLETSMGVTKNG